MTRRSSALNTGCGSERAIASTPRMRPSRVRTGQERNEDVLYQSHSRSARSASRRSNSRSCRPTAPGQSSMRSIRTGLPVSTAASVTPARSGSYGRSSTGTNASRTASDANQDAAGRMWACAWSTTRNETPVTSSSRRTCDTISSSVRRSHTCELAACSMPRSSNMGSTLTAPPGPW